MEHRVAFPFNPSNQENNEEPIIKIAGIPSDVFTPYGCRDGALSLIKCRD
jgi:hypothetical protein